MAFLRPFPIKELLNSFDEESNSDLSIEASIRKSSSKYFYDTEKDCVKEYLSLKLSLLNGADTSKPYYAWILSKDIDKSLISLYCQTNNISLPKVEPDNLDEHAKLRSLKRSYVLHALLELPESEVLDIIHAAYARKGN